MEGPRHIVFYVTWCFGGGDDGPGKDCLPLGPWRLALRTFAPLSSALLPWPCSCPFRNVVCSCGSRRLRFQGLFTTSDFPRSDFLPVGTNCAPVATMREKQALLRRATGSRFPAPAAAPMKEGVVAGAFHDHDRAYFQAYSHVGIHEEMIKDRARTDTYRDAIFFHSDFIRDKVVMDVGCGTGILSIFCANAGARKVYAVDASDIAVQAKEVVKANNLSDIVTVFHGRVEDLQIDEEVDVIVSEWMGYMLLYESMLGSVLYARDRWLKTGGLMLPSFATLYMAPVTNVEKYSECIDFWRSVYGIDMSAMLPLAKQCSFEEPCIETIPAESVLSWPVVIKQINCNTITIGELETVKADFSVSSIMMASLHGFALWFDVSFGTKIGQETDVQSESSLDSSVPGGYDTVGISRSKKRANPDDCIVLSTAPDSTPTHWAQTILYIYDPIEVKQDQEISGSIELSQSKENQRFLNIFLKYRSGNRECVKESVMK